jgi:OmpA-OmpF porin, OOP family
MINKLSFNKEIFMIKFLLMAIIALGLNVQAHQGFELGIGAGTTHPLTPDSFRQTSETGDATLYWLGYGFDSNLGVEISHEVLDFEIAPADSKHKAYTLSLTYDMLSQYMVHPLVKAGLGSFDTEVPGTDKISTTHFKIALGLEANFNYVSVGALFNHFQLKKKDPSIANYTTFLIPSLYLTLHGPREEIKVSAPVAPVAVVKLDSDSDGILDDEDKCPNTTAGLAVNAFGCALTEKASIKLQVEFLSGKSVLDSKFNGEIESLAAFMTKYPNTNVEIAGHTDNVGSVAGNNALSQKRANAVKAALVNAGIEAKRLSAKGYGSSQPIGDNKTVEGKQANRRVMAEVTVVAEKKK